MPSSGSAHNSQSPPPQISPPPNPGWPPAARSPKQFYPSHPSPRSRSPLVLRPHPPNPPSHPRSRCPPPARSAPPHSSRFSLPRRCHAPPTTPRRPHPKPAVTSASHKKSFHPPETVVSPHRSIHKPALARPPDPLLHETHATRAAGETAQSPPNFSSLSPRSTHSPAPLHLSPATAAASAPWLLLRTPPRLRSEPWQVW